jgi:hypothetical protein
MNEIGLALIGELENALDAQRKDLAGEIYKGFDEYSLIVKKRLRNQVIGAGLGNRVAKTWRYDLYPKRGVLTLEPASVIKSKAPQIIEAFSSGEPIRSSRMAGFLAIPTDFAPRRRGGRGRRMSMDDFLEANGTDSLRVYAKPGSGGRVFYAVAEKGFRRSRGKRGGSRRITENSRSKAEKVLMYVLIKQVRLGKRFDVQSVFRGAQRGFAPFLARRLAKGLGQ